MSEGRFSQASMIERRQILEDVLAKTLRSVGEIMHNADGERCIAVLASTGEHTSEWQLTPLWSLASEIEAWLT